MEVNVGKTDKIVRVVTGVLLLAVALASFLNYLDYGIVLEVVALVLGVIFIVTGYKRKCPIYQATGVDSRDYD